AEDGIRDRNVTGVQTCALPISVRRALARPRDGAPLPVVRDRTFHVDHGLKEVVMNDRRYTFGVVVLSQGKRLEELNRGFESLLADRKSVVQGKLEAQVLIWLVL